MTTRFAHITGYILSSVSFAAALIILALSYPNNLPAIAVASLTLATAVCVIIKAGLAINRMEVAE